MNKEKRGNKRENKNLKKQESNEDQQDIQIIILTVALSTPGHASILKNERRNQKRNKHDNKNFEQTSVTVKTERKQELNEDQDIPINILAVHPCPLHRRTCNRHRPASEILDYFSIVLLLQKGDDEDTSLGRPLFSINLRTIFPFSHEQASNSARLAC